MKVLSEIRLRSSYILRPILCIGLIFYIAYHAVQGDRGLIGSRGPHGIQGQIGNTGERGPSGLNGKNGMKGENGTKGDAGKSGKDGLRGLQGDPGPIGKTGPPGIDLRKSEMNKLLPIGSITLWKSENNVYPDGWALCDGKCHEYEGKEICTPNLLQKTPDLSISYIMRVSNTLIFSDDEKKILIHHSGRPSNPNMELRADNSFKENSSLQNICNFANCNFFLNTKDRLTKTVVFITGENLQLQYEDDKILAKNICASSNDSKCQFIIESDELIISNYGENVYRIKTLENPPRYWKIIGESGNQEVILKTEDYALNSENLPSWSKGQLTDSSYLWFFTILQ